MTIDDLTTAARARIARLDPRVALAAQAAGALLIDARCAELRRETGTIPGAVHVPLSVLYWRMDPTSPYHAPALVDPDRQVLLLSAPSYSSGAAARRPARRGRARRAGEPGATRAPRVRNQAA